MNEKRIYEPPLSLDFSDLTARGDGVGPLGTCVTGEYPYLTCTQGAFVASGPCQAGTDPIGDACLSVGSTAVNTCNSGTWV